MRFKDILRTGMAGLAMLALPAAPVWAATTVQIGASGKTYAYTTAQCAINPSSGQSAPMVEAGLFNPKPTATAVVSLNGNAVKAVVATDPTATVWLDAGSNTVVVALSKRVADKYTFTVAANQCTLPNTSGNTFSGDGTLEYAASGKSYATVVPGCALNGATGQAQPYVNLFDNGSYLLNVSVNGVPLTQLSALRPHTPVFLRAGLNVISAANGSLSTDFYVRDGASGSCVIN